MKIKKLILFIFVLLMLFTGCSSNTASVDFEADNEYKNNYLKIEKKLEEEIDLDQLIQEVDELIQTNPEIAGGYLLKAEIYKNKKDIAIEDQEAYIDTTIDEALNLTLTQEQVNKLLDYYSNRRNRFMEVVNVAKTQNINIDSYSDKITEIENYYSEFNGETFGVITSQTEITNSYTIADLYNSYNRFLGNSNWYTVFNIKDKVLFFNSDYLSAEDSLFNNEDDSELYIANKDFTDIKKYQCISLYDGYSNFVSGDWFYFVRYGSKDNSNFIMINRININDNTLEKKYMKVEYIPEYNLADFFIEKNNIIIKSIPHADKYCKYYVGIDLQKPDLSSTIQNNSWDDKLYIDLKNNGYVRREDDIHYFYDKDLNELFKIDVSPYFYDDGSTYAYGDEVIYEGSLYISKLKYKHYQGADGDFALSFELFKADQTGKITKLAFKPNSSVFWGSLGFVNGKLVIAYGNGLGKTFIHEIVGDSVTRNTNMEDRVNYLEPYEDDIILYFNDENNFAIYKENRIELKKDGTINTIYLKDLAENQ